MEVIGIYEHKIIRCLLMVKALGLSERAVAISKAPRSLWFQLLFHFILFFFLFLFPASLGVDVLACVYSCCPGAHVVAVPQLSCAELLVRPSLMHVQPI